MAPSSKRPVDGDAEEGEIKRLKTSNGNGKHQQVPTYDDTVIEISDSESSDEDTESPNRDDHVIVKCPPFGQRLGTNKIPWQVLDLKMSEFISTRKSNCGFKRIKMAIFPNNNKGKNRDHPTSDDDVIEISDSESSDNDVIEISDSESSDNDDVELTIIVGLPNANNGNNRTEPIWNNEANVLNEIPSYVPDPEEISKFINTGLLDAYGQMSNADLVCQYDAIDSVHMPCLSVEESEDWLDWAKL